MPVTNYVWNPLHDSYLRETDENDETTAVYTVEPVPYGRVVSQRRDEETSYFHYDALGSTRELTDEAEQLTDTNIYDAWGVNLASTGTIETPFRYVGEWGYYADQEVNANYVRRRAYKPADGRWMSEDPAGYVDGPNQYLYVRNNPVNHLDASGLIKWEKQLDCQSPGADACYCDFGSCEFIIDFSQGANDYRVCFSHSPAEPPNEVPEPGSRTCHSWITRTQNADDHVSGKPRGDLPECKFTIDNFPPNSPTPIWDRLPDHCRPPDQP